MGNLRTIILYAVVGTIVNFLLIGKELSSNNTNHAQLLMAGGVYGRFFYTLDNF